MQAQSLLMLARAFIEHQLHHSKFSHPRPRCLSLGFHAARAVWLFGLKVRALKLVNTAFYSAFLAVFYAPRAPAPRSGLFSLPSSPSTRRCSRDMT
jgi:hypothetical protein